jgi:putative toxin-antitoxin system antitoxin component (TIGR02293 family)
MVTVEFKPTGATPLRRGAYLQQLGLLLDAPVRTGADLVSLARARLHVAVIDRLSEQGLKWDELSFIIARRTLTHRREKDEPLTADESDKVIRLAKLIAQANATFGNDDRAIQWLRSAQSRFDGQSALEMASTEQGARLVEEALVQIDEGYFA